MAKKKDPQGVYPDDYPDELMKKVEFERQFHKDNPIEALDSFFEGKASRVEAQEYYEHDDIFRKEADSLKARFEKKFKTAKKGQYVKLDEELRKEQDELLAEARLRRHILSFDTMKKNYYARKKEFEKIEKVFK